jgi:hypothetical protein
MHRLVRLRPYRGVLFTGVLVALMAFPIGVIASHQFTDVPDSNPYHDDIDAIADAGVTTGCGGGKYCPTDYVTRQQMAAFMNRLGALEAGKTPVVNAATSLSTDGWSLGCPTDTVLGGGLCFDTATRGSGNVFDASVACGNLGSNVIFGRGQIWKLPSVLELRAADINGDVAITAPEWSSTYYFDDANGAQAASYNGDQGTSDHNTLDVLPYRCAALPMQRDLFILISGDEPQDGSKAAPSEGKPGKVNEDGSRK